MSHLRLAKKILRSLPTSFGQVGSRSAFRGCHSDPDGSWKPGLQTCDSRETRNNSDAMVTNDWQSLDRTMGEIEDEDVLSARQQINSHIGLSRFAGKKQAPQHGHGSKTAPQAEVKQSAYCDTSCLWCLHGQSFGKTIIQLLALIVSLRWSVFPNILIVLPAHIFISL